MTNILLIEGKGEYVTVKEKLLIYISLLLMTMECWETFCFIIQLFHNRDEACCSGYIIGLSLGQPGFGSHTDINFLFSFILFFIRIDQNTLKNTVNSFQIFRLLILQTNISDCDHVCRLLIS
jgi:hypothetical protein